MPQYSYSLIHAFADSPDSGNPAGVVVLQPSGRSSSDEISLKDVYPPDDELQRIATKLKQPMTAFAIPLSGSASGQQESGRARYGLRWFNPVEEAFLCGHATMATSAQLFSEQDKLQTIDFATMQYGTISASRIPGAETSGRLEDVRVAMDFPEITEMSPLQPASEEHRTLVDLLEQASGGTWGAEDLLQICKSPGRVVVEIPQAYQLAAMKMDCKALASLAPLAIIFTQIAPEAPSVDSAEHIRSRVFVIVSGFEHEDHVTGSAHCLVVPYFTLNTSARERLVAAAGQLPMDPDNSNNTSLRVRQVSPRGGNMLVTWRRAEKKVRIAGQCLPAGAGHVDA